LSLNLSRQWKTIAIISIKTVATALLVAAMVYSPTYFASDSMNNNYAWIWGGLILFAIWTKRNRPVAKSIASLGPLLFVWGLLQFLFEMHEGKWLIFLALVAVGVLIFLAIWLKRPSTDSPSNSNNDYDERVSQKNLKGLSGWLILWVYWQLSFIILTLNEPYNISEESFGFYAVIFLLVNAYLLYLYFGKKKGFPLFVIGYLCVFSLSILIPFYSGYYNFLASMGKVIPIIIWIPYFLKSKRVKMTFVKNGWFPFTSSKTKPVPGEIHQPEISDIVDSSESHITEKPKSQDNQDSELGNVICGNCQFNISEDFEFCPKCGKRLTPQICKKCKAELKSNYKFCPKCGESI